MPNIVVIYLAPLPLVNVIYPPSALSSGLIVTNVIVRQIWISDTTKDRKTELYSSVISNMSSDIWSKLRLRFECSSGIIETNMPLEESSILLLKVGVFKILHEDVFLWHFNFIFITNMYPKTSFKNSMYLKFSSCFHIVFCVTLDISEVNR